MLIITGRGATAGVLPAPLATTRPYFDDLAAFIAKIEDVDTVKPLGKPYTYLVTHQPIGAMNYYVTVAYTLVGTPTETGFTLSSYDFEAAKLKSAHPVIKGYVNGALALTPHAEGEQTHIDLKFELKVELPLPTPLKLVPRGLVQTTADGIMTVKVATSVESMHRKVLADFV